MRGKDLPFSCNLRRFGITPAYAGKSNRLIQSGGCAEDHPRLCGEKIFYTQVRKWYIGSPPPMRGKVVLCGTGFVRNGITPAYAGKRK